MFDKILKTAQETGADVIMLLKNLYYDQYKGKIIDVDQEYFSLFHSGPGGGVHWVFKRNDIASIGLVVSLPDLKQVDGNQTTQNLIASELLRTKKEKEEDKNT